MGNYVKAILLIEHNMRVVMGDFRLVFMCSITARKSPRAIPTRCAKIRASSRLIWEPAMWLKMLNVRRHPRLLRRDPRAQRSVLQCRARRTCDAPRRQWGGQDDDVEDSLRSTPATHCGTVQLDDEALRTVEPMKSFGAASPMCLRPKSFSRVSRYWKISKSAVTRGRSMLLAPSWSLSCKCSHV